MNEPPYDASDDARKGYDVGIAMLRWRLAIVKALKWKVANERPTRP